MEVRLLLHGTRCNAWVRIPPGHMIAEQDVLCVNNRALDPINNGHTHYGWTLTNDQIEWEGHAE